MMRYAPVDSEKVIELIVDIQENVRELEGLVGVTEEEFLADKKNYGLADFHFRRALEGVLTVGTHILSRLPARIKDYQEIILELGNHGIIPKDFSEKNRELASYRNRMVHAYWKVTPKELFGVIREHIADITRFCEYYREVVRHPEKFGLEIEK